jgi:two-component system response regulator NreC
MTDRDLTVVLAEAHPQMRAGMRRVIDGEPRMRVLAGAGDLALTRQHLAGHRPDVLVLDLTMPDGSAIDALREICASPSPPGVVVASVEDVPGFAARALAAGAYGFVLKDRADIDLPVAVRAAARGQRFVSEPVAARLAASPV